MFVGIIYYLGQTNNIWKVTGIYRSLEDALGDRPSDDTFGYAIYDESLKLVKYFPSKNGEPRPYLDVNREIASRIGHDVMNNVDPSDALNDAKYVRQLLELCSYK